jgi:hypothetical protein
VPEWCNFARRAAAFLPFIFLPRLVRNFTTREKGKRSKYEYCGGSRAGSNSVSPSVTELGSCALASLLEVRGGLGMSNFSRISGFFPASPGVVAGRGRWGAEPETVCCGGSRVRPTEKDLGRRPLEVRRWTTTCWCCWNETDFGECKSLVRSSVDGKPGGNTYVGRYLVA